MKTLTTLVAFLVLVQNLFAGIEHFSERIEGSSIPGENEIFLYNAFELYDDKYYDMNMVVSWPNQFTNYKVKNWVTVGLNRKELQTSTFSGIVQLSITYETWDQVSSSFIPNNVLRDLAIEYDSNGEILINDKSTFSFQGAHKIKVEIVGLTNVSAKDIFIESHIEVERFYNLTQTNILGLSDSPLPINQPYSSYDNEFIDLHWDFVKGAERYELEYVHINDYTLTQNVYIPMSDIPFNYYLNSTRVEITKNHYKVPNIFDHGYFIYRVRAVGVSGTNFGSEVYGEWSAPESGLIGLNHVNYQNVISNVIAIEREYGFNINTGSRINWSHQVGFSENGKRFEGVSFSDGLGRGRQSIGMNSVTKQTVFSNVYFDIIGRPVVSDLPTPINLEFPRHIPDFNRADVDLFPTYNYLSFDDPATSDGICVFDQYGMVNTSGASKYYSPNNTDQDGANGTIPNAENFPFSRINYLKDFTGRLDKVSSAGPTLSLGQGRETGYVYATATQAELNDLFGTEVGLNTHYQKLVTIDPNGQAYVQYTDMAGRVVASYLMGPAPTNLDGIFPDPEVEEIVIMEDGSGQIPDNGTHSATLTYVQYFAEAEEEYVINYNFTPQQFESICLVEPVCFDCVYNLKLKIEEKCGQILHESEIPINGEDLSADLDAICNGEPFDPIELILDIPRGEYTFTKTLEVNQQAINEYWCDYLDNLTDDCLTPMSIIFNDLYNLETFPECDEYPVSPIYGGAEGCELNELLMASDITPGGQYAMYSVNGGVYTCNDPVSIFFGPNPTYQTFDFGSITVLDPANPSNTISPADLSVEDYILLFDPSWATFLIENEPNAHPESCMLGFCDANADSYAYDQAIQNTYTFDLAANYDPVTEIGGYFLPFNFTSIPDYGGVDLTFGINYGNCDVNLDPFFVLNPTYAAGMMNDMNQFYEFEVVDGCVFLNIWQFAALQAYYEMNPDEAEDIVTLTCNDFKNLIRKIPCYDDLIWIKYRELYLDLKSQYVQQAMEAYAAANCPSMPEIGTGNGPYAGSYPRFPSLDFIDNTLNNGLTEAGYTGPAIDFSNPSNTPANNPISDLVNGQIQNGCESACAEFVDEWMDQLSGCNITSNLAQIEQSLLLLCSNGCDENHPSGASTPNPNSVYIDQNLNIPPGNPIAINPTIEDILSFYGYNQSMYCTSLLFEQPLPYDYTVQLSNMGIIPLDHCVCDKVFSAIESVSGSGFTYPEELFEENTGVSMDDINYLKCACEETMPLNDVWSPNYVWPASSISALTATGIQVYSSLGCAETNGCASWAMISDALTDLLANFGFTTAPTLKENYELFMQVSTSEVILKNFLNYELGFSLQEQDYIDFIGGSLATPDDPYCKVNPLFEEISALLKLILFKGQLISANQVNLLTDNIVYKHSDLAEEGIGQFFSSSINGDELSLTFSDNLTNSCSINLLLNEDSEFNFSDIISFEAFYPTTTNCTGNSTFDVLVNYYSCGTLKNGLISGTTDCFDVNLCVCGPGELLCNIPAETVEPPCYEERLEELYNMTFDIYDDQFAEQYDLFSEQYNTQCSLAFGTEDFSYIGPLRIYQHTLFYYDQAGNLVKTVAPLGVQQHTFTDENIAVSRNSVDGPNTAVAPLIPDHTYKTEYVYNSYDQLVSTTNPDQDGETKFFYDRYGRIAASQNPVQAQQNKYSYTFYDPIGRPIMVGQTSTTVPLTETILKTDDLGVGFQNWANSGTQSEITLTVYDQSLSSAFSALFANGQQENLRLRVASVFYFPSEGNFANYESAIHYSYDIHGNVKEQIQDVPMMNAVAQQHKSTQYNYELLSGNVKEVLFQEDKPDKMIHVYHYDELNRLTEAETSTDDVHYSREAHYRYYDYGPLARVEYGEYQVQGQDFAYTINGWLKGMNSSLLDENEDIGKDGVLNYLNNNVNVHNAFAKDVTAFTLGYFQGDYSPINGNSFEISYGAPGSVFNLYARNLYNGNIRSLVTSIYGMGDVPGGFETIAKGFHYDQLNRLTEMRAFTDDIGTATGPTASILNIFANNYSYDKNGNLKTLQRYDGGGALFDDFEYAYDEPRNSGDNNILTSVEDNVLLSNLVADDIEGGMDSDNYVYDDLGQLIEDKDEEITLTWRTGDKKLSSISEILGVPTTKPRIDFVYNPFGQRVLKIVKPRDGSGNQLILDPDQWKYTYYAYDANGQVMAVYDATISGEQNKATLAEQHIYGASRLGMIKPALVLFENGDFMDPPADVLSHTLGEKFYELGNYLGNVEAVITDRKTPDLNAGPGLALFVATVISTSDYYPFGMQIPNPNNINGDYRYAYNGMELDNEVSGTGNSYTTEFRQYDPRLGRWKSLDPMKQMFPSMSPYTGFGNNPIVYVDPKGDVIIFGVPWGETTYDHEVKYIKRQLLIKSILGGER